MKSFIIAGDWYSPDIWSDFMQHYQCGYSDCMREVARFMTDVEGVNANDSRCTRLLTYLQTRFRPHSSVSGGLPFKHTLHRVASAGNFLTTSAIGQTAQDDTTSPSRDLIGSDRYSARLMSYSLPHCAQFPVGLPASRSHSSRTASSNKDTKSGLVRSSSSLPGCRELEHEISGSCASDDVIGFDQNGWPRSEHERGHGSGPIRRAKHHHRQK